MQDTIPGQTCTVEISHGTTTSIRKRQCARSAFVTLNAVRYTFNERHAFKLQPTIDSATCARDRLRCL